MAISSNLSEKKSAGTGDHDHSRDYRAMLDQVRQNFHRATAGQEALFSVASDKTALWNLYLNSFPAHDRQHYNCNECRKFFERYGDLVTVDDRGRLTSVMFHEEPDGEYADHFAKLRSAIESGTIEHLHVTEEVKWGLARTGVWEHFAVQPPKELVGSHSYLTAYQQEAEVTADFHTMVRALTEYTADHLKTAMTILESESLYRGEKVIGPARWLQRVIEDQNTTKNAKHRHNLLWRAVALAPAGFAKPRGNAIGTLLDDIKDGLPINDIRARFAAKMDPTKYNRPQTDPGAGNIQQAEKIVAALGVAPSFARRFARLEDVIRHAVWKPRGSVTVTNGGVFGHLTPREAKEAEKTLMKLPSKKMTFEKFVNTVLPVAEAIEMYIASVMPFTAMLTAVDESAPPIYQWDAADNRNPVSWYLYPQGSTPAQWGLRMGKYVNVTAITRGPAEWGTKRFPNHGERLIFTLEDCHDSNGENVGLALFPEYLNSDLHGIRKTIEAHSKSGKLAGLRQATASGVSYAKGDHGSLTVRVKNGASVQVLELDRWD